MPTVILNRTIDISGSSEITNPENTLTKPLRGYCTVHDFGAIGEFTLHRNDGGDMPATFEAWVQTLNIPNVTQTKLDEKGADQWYKGAKLMCENYWLTDNNKVAHFVGFRSEIFTQDKGGAAYAIIIAIALGAAVIIFAASIAAKIFELSPEQTEELIKDVTGKIQDTVFMVAVLLVIAVIIIVMFGGKASLGKGNAKATLASGRRTGYELATGKGK